MSEIKVGEYVRTKEGVIAKVCAITEFKEFIEGASVFSYCYDTNKGIKAGRDILKHSPNMIDLIEVGDYVNGYKVVFDESMGKLAILRVNGSNIRHTAIEYFVDKNANEQIESIVTHEQFKNMEYRVGE